MILSPAYDLLSTRLLRAENQGEMELAINGEKARIEQDDFIARGKNVQKVEKND
jgi:serine/threonine protein kinase HipA of HipAB toxin-antitoxin module